ncbi:MULTISPECIES: methyl-accepting chemotaxis protein [Virgibacillus]|uniref:Methyl-accepting chemotaxis protein McpB n=1 Tax=Virgibacillus dokdonensis TaxID=302167 RepID=A0A2K9IVD3_9BACI|nr:MULTISPECIES: methyl-accepting chemotaxis protein [Virgibacillus]AUJ23707.1 Methyl-accepting chemotaxis protein McpB [Virgibacillus dokdonensis]NWO14956.1 methyl-accepting chemotaxis protein [Virgibacillus sp.]
MRNLKIAKKFFLLITFAVLLSIIISVVQFTYLHDMADDSIEMYEKYLVSIDKLGKIQKNNVTIDAYSMEAMMTNDQNTYNDLIQRIDELASENEKLETKKLYPKQIMDTDSYSMLVDDYIQGRNNALQLAKDDQEAGYNYYVDHVLSKRIEIDEIMTKIQEHFSDKANKMKQKNQKDLNEVSLIVIAITMIGIIAFMVVSLWIVKSIIKPIKHLRHIMKTAEQGKLVISDYKANDELGQLVTAFNGMITTFKDLLSSTQEASENVVASSEQLSASAGQNTQASEHVASAIQEVAAGSANQLEHIEKTADTMDMMISSFQKINDDTSIVSSEAKSSAELSRKGEKEMNDVIGQMEVIRHNVTNLGKTIHSLSSSLTEINAMNQTITDIASQTNLLALNAAIEAARAGEHGEGFSVVAEEVRKLAEQSNESAKQITHLIENIQQETNETMESMDVTDAAVETGTTVVHEAGSTFEKIESTFNSIISQFAKISENINQLSSGAQNLQTSMNEIKEIVTNTSEQTQTVSAATEEQLASIEEVESSAENLAKISEELQELVNKFE